MTAYVAPDQFYDLSVRFVSEAEARYRRQFGADARRVLARRAGLAPGTIESLRKRRLKGLKDAMREKLMAFVVAEISAEISRLEGDLALAKSAASRPDESLMFEASAALESARRLISEICTVPARRGAPQELRRVR